MNKRGNVYTTFFSFFSLSIFFFVSFTFPLIFFFHLPSLLDLLHPTLRTAGALPPMSQLRSLQLVPLPPPPAGDRLQAYAIAPAPTAGRLQPRAQSCRWLPLGDAPAPVVGRLQL